MADEEPPVAAAEATSETAAATSEAPAEADETQEIEDMKRRVQEMEEEAEAARPSLRCEHRAKVAPHQHGAQAEEQHVDGVEAAGHGGEEGRPRTDWLTHSASCPHATRN